MKRLELGSAERSQINHFLLTLHIGLLLFAMIRRLRFLAMRIRIQQIHRS
jgi:hypothetical protein